MDSSLAIQASGLSKKYRLGTIGMTSLREDLGRWWNRGKSQDVMENNSSPSSINKSHMINDREFWALHDLDFSIRKGEVVGLIGANGSGKSTLLKILSRITEPTEGKIQVRGKVASLLEVGTGFHPELTGRENVYVNGAILGMTRKEVTNKFEEIVDFAGVSDFIDTPIKRYSSGMTVRLGFAVAAHLDPDILIVDEVLAVGDASFQKKCVGKMQHISSEGKTILLVSHQMLLIENLCPTSVLLIEGEIKGHGNTKDIIQKYYDITIPTKLLSRNIIDIKERQGSGEIILSEVKIYDKNKNAIKAFRPGKEAFFKLEFKKFKNFNVNKLGGICLSVNIDNSSNQRLAMMSNIAISSELSITQLVCEGVMLKIFKLPLMPGKYSLTVFLGREDYIIDWIQSAFSFIVLDSDYYSTGKSQVKGHGDILIDYTMEHGCDE
jgi:lipopolysaccharide transport system ATP-binding protein